MADHAGFAPGVRFSLICPYYPIYGQVTVFFAIVTGPGISVTDERLLDWAAPSGDKGKREKTAG